MRKNRYRIAKHGVLTLQSSFQSIHLRKILKKTREIQALFSMCIIRTKRTSRRVLTPLEKTGLTRIFLTEEQHVRPMRAR